MSNQEFACDICCVGHITKDKIVTPEHTLFMAGGTAFYFSHAIRHFRDIRYSLHTIVGESEQEAVYNLRSAGIEVSARMCRNSVYFENIYEENSDKRKQHVLSKADPFDAKTLLEINARIVHLGPLLADDFPLEAVKAIAKKQPLSIDAQGFLREVRGIGVYPVDWREKEHILKDVHFLKANEQELRALTGTGDIMYGIKKLGEWGVKEIIVTLGHDGSIILDGKNYYKIPAYRPRKTVDATGCGDTYMAGYLYSRLKNKSVTESGNCAAAMATLKIEHSGPFSGGLDDILTCINTREKKFTDIPIG